MTYLAKMTSRLLPAEAKARSRALQWLMFQIGGVGPMQRQANVFYNDANEHETEKFVSKIQGIVGR
jgi:glutathione S-transferase